MIRNNSILFTVLVLGLSILTISSILFLEPKESFSQKSTLHITKQVQTLTHYLLVHLTLDPLILLTIF